MGFELGRGLAAEGRVSSVSVVVGFDVGEDLGSGVLMVEEATALKHIRSENNHERFSPGVVVRIGPSCYALSHARLVKELAIGSLNVICAKPMQRN